MQSIKNATLIILLIIGSALMYQGQSTVSAEPMDAIIQDTHESVSSSLEYLKSINAKQRDGGEVVHVPYGDLSERLVDLLNSLGNDFDQTRDPSFARLQEGLIDQDVISFCIKQIRTNISLIPETDSQMASDLLNELEEMKSCLMK